MTQYQREYYAKNKERILARMKTYREKNPEAVRQTAQRSEKKHSKERYARRKNNEQYQEYMKTYNVHHYTMRKKRFDELKVGGCTLCGYNVHPSSLDFHHKNPEEKAWTSNQFMNRNWEVAQEEAAKCILVCANCHRLLHVVLPVD
jgi:hypothetical protein